MRPIIKAKCSFRQTEQLIERREHSGFPSAWGDANKAVSVQRGISSPLKFAAGWPTVAALPEVRHPTAPVLRGNGSKSPRLRFFTREFDHAGRKYGIQNGASHNRNQFLAHFPHKDEKDPWLLRTKGLGYHLHAKPGSFPWKLTFSN